MIDFRGDYKMTIDGELKSGSKTFDALNPARREVIGKVPDASREQLDEAVAAARKAFVGWSETPWSQRQRALVGMAELLEGQSGRSAVRRFGCGSSPSSH